MKRIRLLRIGVVLLGVTCASNITASAPTAKHDPFKTIAAIDGTSIANPPSGDWLSNGRDYREQRFSPLAAINTGNVKNLGVAWEFRTHSVRALEATPIVANGVMFISSA